MDKTPKYDARVKEVLDALEPGERTCKATGEVWDMDQEEIAWYKKFNVPPPSLSPTARIRLIGSFLTGFQWWTNKHAETGKPLITSTHPATGIKVLPDKEWFAKDFQEINLDYDRTEVFFAQLYRLQHKIPIDASHNYQEPENSITLASMGDQNSYFCLASSTKNCFYSVAAVNCENSAEVFSCKDVNQSYNIIHSQRMFNCRYTRECFDCLNSYFLFDCRNCESCFGAINKRNKKFLWFNEQLSESEYNDRISKIDFGSRSQVEELEAKFEALLSEAVWPTNFNDKCDNCTGDYLTDCVDCKMSYFMLDSKDCYWTAFGMKAGENNAFMMGMGAQNTYYSAPAGGLYGCKFCSWGTRNQDCEYSIACYDCENCFGCVGIRHKKFCILNKQYEEGEYWELVDEIKCAMMDQKEYGEFLPAKFSYQYFPESGAANYFTASDEDGRNLGGHMFNPESHDAFGKEIVGTKETRQTSEIPDHIDQVEPEEMSGVPFFDKDYDRRFAFVKPELEFYKRYGIAPPNKHFLRRVRYLYACANAGVFEKAKCVQCAADLVVAQNKNYQERKLYCRDCYLKHLEVNG